jgi:uncharacterized membrane protein required for colicin V production
LEDRMRRFLGALFGFLLGYPIFAFLGYWAILLLSNNQFDRSVEASMMARSSSARRARLPVLLPA